HDGHDGHDDERFLKGADREDVVDDVIVEEHAGGGDDQDASADVVEDRVAVDGAGDQAAAEEQDRHGERQAEDEQADVPVGGAAHGQDVVEAHDDVGHDDGLQRFAQRAGGLDLMMVFDRLEQLEGDVEEQERADRLEQRDIEQERGQHGEEHAQPDCAGPTPDDRLAALLGRQAAGGHADDHSVITRQHQIDDDDADELSEKF